MLKQFEALSRVLLKHENVWKQSVFQHTHFSTLDTYPKLKEWLFGLSDSSLLNYQENDDLLLSVVSPYFDDALSIIDLIDFPISKRNSNHTYLNQR